MQNEFGSVFVNGLIVELKEIPQEMIKKGLPAGAQDFRSGRQGAIFYFLNIKQELRVLYDRV